MAKKTLDQYIRDSVANEDDNTQAAPNADETTKLNAQDETKFQSWAHDNNIQDVNEPDTFYDYRGAFKAGEKPDENGHWVDTYKQHGHPTFSVESQYSKGVNDGGTWDANGQFIPPGTSPIPGEQNLQFGVNANVNPDKNANTVSTPIPGTEVPKLDAKGNPIPITQPQIFKGVQQLNADQTQTAADRGEQEEANAEDLNNVYEKQHQEAQKEINDQNKLIQEYQDFGNKTYADLRQKAIDIGKQKIDPDHWYNSKSTGGKLAAIGGLLLGGIGQGLAMWGGNKSAHNEAIDAVDQAITQDIDSQDKHNQASVTSYLQQKGLADTQANRMQATLLMKHAQWKLMHDNFIDDLAAQGAKSNSNLVKYNTQSAVEALRGDQLKNDQQFADYIAKQQNAANAIAAGLAAKRDALRKEIGNNYMKMLEKYNDLPADEARVRAAQDVTGMGYAKSDLAPVLDANGIKTDAKTGEYIFPKPEKPVNEDPLNPTVDPSSGRLIKPEVREKIEQLKIPFNGTTRLARDPADAVALKLQIDSNEKLKTFREALSGPNGYIAKFDAGTLTPEDIGKWDGLATSAITSFNTASTATPRATGQGETKILAEDAIPRPPSAGIGLQLGNASEVWRGKIAALKTNIDQNDAAVNARLRPLSEETKKSTPANQPVKINFTPK